LAADPRFRNNVERMRHFDELIAAVTPEMRKRSTQEWVATLDAAGVPVSPVLQVGEMHKDPQAIARGMIAEVTHSVLGPVKTLGNPLKFSKTPGELGAGAPVLGEHTREVLLAHGYDAAEIDALVAAGAIQCAEAGDAQPHVKVKDAVP
jgi:crotonobetainyl-CoA:carnitine CoA-transferase CaiB-like acyl-CoA transferase